MGMEEGRGISGSRVEGFGLGVREMGKKKTDANRREGLYGNRFS